MSAKQRCLPNAALPAFSQQALQARYQVWQLTSGHDCLRVFFPNLEVGAALGFFQMWKPGLTGRVSPPFPFLEMQARRPTKPMSFPCLVSRVIPLFSKFGHNYQAGPAAGFFAKFGHFCRPGTVPIAWPARFSPTLSKFGPPELPELFFFFFYLLLLLLGREQ